MYRTKREHSTGFGATNPLQGAVSGPLGTAGELRSTLRARGLNIAYQPIINLATGKIVAMEALARWTTSAPATARSATCSSSRSSTC